MENRTPAEVIAYAQEQGVEYVDLRFCDLPGLMQHFSAPLHQLSEDVFEEGFGFDGSSIRGFQEIQESDMILLPDASTAVIDPFRPRKTLNLNCFVHDPLTGEAYSRDPRNIARKAEAYLGSTGLADTAYFGPEAEFFIFDGVSYNQTINGAFYEVNSDAAAWNLGNKHEPRRRPEPRLQAPDQGGLLPGAPRRPVPGPPLRHGLRARGRRRGDRDPPPRGGHRRPGRDRHALRHPAAGGRQADALQVHRQERRLGGRQDRDLHAQAAVPGQRLGHAHPPVAVEGRRRRCSTTATSTPVCPTWPAGTSAACCATPRPCWRSPRRRRTPTSAWCPATRRR